jgi:hypothetical protein
MLATPVAAQAPAPPPTASDGTYVGVSRTFEGVIGGVGTGTRGCTQKDGQPGPLTITGGVVRYNGLTLVPYTAEGSVNSQGVLVMHAPRARIDAQIDGRGTVTGRITSYCSYHMVWQKEGR